MQADILWRVRMRAPRHAHTAALEVKHACAVTDTEHTHNIIWWHFDLSWARDAGVYRNKTILARCQSLIPCCLSAQS
jgi:hypothetical protein